MSMVAGCQLVRPVRWGAWVEDYIKKCLFEPASQKRLALMSNLASSPRMLVLMDNTSPVRVCRGGFTMTSLHTSFSRSAVLSRRSLWRMDGYPPVGQDSACAIVKNCAQTHCEASIGGDQPYIPQAKGVTLPYAG